MQALLFGMTSSHASLHSLSSGLTCSKVLILDDSPAAWRECERQLVIDPLQPHAPRAYANSLQFLAVAAGRYDGAEGAKQGGVPHPLRVCELHAATMRLQYALQRPLERSANPGSLLNDAKQDVRKRLKHKEKEQYNERVMRAADPHLPKYEAENS